MSYLQKEVVRKTLALVALWPNLLEGEAGDRQGIVVRAKTITRELAGLLNMPEALSEYSLMEQQLVNDETVSRYIIATGRLAKVCEALDHLENFPYRETLEKNIRIILSL